MKNNKYRNKVILSIGFCLVLLAAMASSTVMAAWPMFAHDAQGTGMTTAPTFDTYCPGWQIAFDDYESSSMVQADGYVYLGKTPSKITSISIATQKTKWTKSLDASIQSTPVINNGKLYVATVAGTVYCLNAATGSVLWSYAIPGSSVTAPITYANDMIFVAVNTMTSTPLSYSSKVYCFNAATSAVLWTSQKFDGYIKVAPAYTNMGFYSGLVYVGTTAMSSGGGYTSGGGVVYGLKANDGQYFWSYQTTGTIITSSPCFTDFGSQKTRLYLGANTGFYCFDADPDDNGDGTIHAFGMGEVDEGYDDPTGVKYDLIWYKAFTQPMKKVTNPIVDKTNDNVIVAYEKDKDVQIDCYYASPDEDLLWKGKWSHTLTDETLGKGVLPNAPILVNENKVQIGASKTFAIFDPSTGDVLWSYPIGYSNSHIIGDEGNLYFSSGKKFHTWVENFAPTTPATPLGPDRGNVGVRYNISIPATTDPEGHNLCYFVDWGDGTSTDWMEFYASGEDVSISPEHSWSESGDYAITIKVKDQYGAISEPSAPLVIHIDHIDISSIKGGFGITADITNDGVYAKDIEWSVSAIGGTIPGFHFMKYYEGTIEPLLAGETQTISTGPLFGLGKFKITITASAAGEPVEEEVIDGFIFFFYIILR